MPKRVRDRVLLDKEYTLVRVRAQRVVGDTKEYLCDWKGYGPDGSTWEPEDHLGKDKKKIDALQKTVPVDIFAARYLLQDAIALQLTSKKIDERSAVFEKTVLVTGITDKAVIEALLKLWRKQCDGALVDIDREPERKGYDVLVTIDQLDHLGALVNLQETRPCNGLCNLRIKCGGPAYEDMIMVTPPFYIGYKLRKVGGYELATVKFTYSTTIFHGKTGQPTFPVAPKGSGLPQEMREHVVAWAKRLLKQRWSQEPIPSHLKRKGWPLLPAGSWKLSRQVAYGV